MMQARSTPVAAKPPRGTGRDVLFGAGLALAYFVAAVAGLQWAILPGAGTSVWPAAGIAFAGLVTFGSRLWPAIVVGRLAAAIAVDSAPPLWADALVGVATMLGAYVPARLLESRARALDPSLGSMRDMLWLALGGAGAGALISGTLGAGALWLGGAAAGHLPHAWLNWSFGYFVGVLTVAPLILSWTAPGALRLDVRSWLHLSAICAATALLSVVVLTQTETAFLRTWHILPALVWAALAFNVRGVSVALAIVSAFAIAAAEQGTGPLATISEDPVARVLMTQQFIAMTALTLLFLAAIADERRDAESLGRLAAIVSSSPEAMLSVDREGRLLSWNRGAEELFGWRAEEAIGKPCDILLPEEGRQAGAGLARALAGEVVREEAVRLARDGTPIATLETQAPVRGPGGRVLGAAVVLRDVRARRAAEEALRRLNESLEQRVAERTRELEEANVALRAQIDARQAAEAQLRQAQKMEAVGQLTGGIAHDFNNMLTVVIGSLDLAKKRAGGLDPRTAGLLDHALDGAVRAARLTARLLAFSRQQPLAPEATDVNRLVAGMSELLCRTLGEAQRVETVLAGGLWTTLVDPHQLENALLNLAVNARDAMPAGGRLTIETANAHLDDAYVATHPGVAPGEYVRVSVTDTGDGMTPEVMDRIFDPFFTTKEPGKGTGLGLSMVYGFVKQSDGHVKVCSEPGRGTTVTLYLPRRRGAVRAPEPEAASGAAAGPHSASQRTVLVVEDDPAVRRLSVEMLDELGYGVIEAGDPQAALAALDEPRPIDLLFTDVVMPDVDGRRLAEMAKSMRPGLPVLYTTGYTRNAVVHDGVLDPGVSLLTKPFTIGQLAAKLREMLP